MRALTDKSSSAGSRAASAYSRVAREGRRYSWLIDEAVEVHPDEIRALRGEDLPRRFRWRDRWHRIQEVASVWQDGRKRSGAHGRTYACVSGGPEGYFEMYYDKVWMIYRKIEMR
ncbi:MAG: hypothetical protein EXS64_11085 [Candidatus Latescibacteria bacterium]|nr:hypothetical protein [Candidatus Latescibacterota bacterium]